VMPLGVEIAGYVAGGIFLVMGIRGRRPPEARKTLRGLKARIRSYRNPLQLIDSFPKDNEQITTKDVKQMYLKFNKPIDKTTEQHIVNKYVRRNLICQWNICGWVEYAEGDTKLVWHVTDKELEDKAKYGSPPQGVDYHTFEIQIGREPSEWRVKATDGTELPLKIIRVKIREE